MNGFNAVVRKDPIVAAAPVIDAAPIVRSGIAAPALRATNIVQPVVLRSNNYVSEPYLRTSYLANPVLRTAVNYGSLLY